MASVDVVCVNSGTMPTYVREGWGQSVVDITFVSAELVGYVSGWYVTEEETLSDHWLLYFEIEQLRPSKGMLDLGDYGMMHQGQKVLEGC